jgi:polar amino acid transport system permease protein
MNYTFQFGDVLRYWPLLAEGAAVTLGLSVGAMIICLVLGTIGALAQQSKYSLSYWLSRGYVETIRNTPLLVQLFILFFGLPSVGISLPSNIAAFAGLCIYNGAYATEILRAGIEAVHPSQIEAGLSIGMSRLQVFRHIVARPALEKIYPALSSHFILLMLGTSVVSAIGAEELTGYAGQIQSLNFRSLEVYLICTIIYLVLALVIRSFLRVLGLKLFGYRRRETLLLAA